MNSALYMLGYEKWPVRFPEIAWKLQWFPDWFLAIDRCFEKIILPQANVRLEYVLERKHVKRVQPLPIYVAMIKQRETEFEALKSLGANAILQGKCPAIRTNVASYSGSACGRNPDGTLFAWGQRLMTDNYGKVLQRTSVNEFDDYDTRHKLSEHLDAQLSDYFWSHGIWKDEIARL